MNKFLRSTTTALLFAATTFAALADDLAKLEGKWSTKKTGPDGNSYTQVIEIKKDKFKFRLLRGGNDLALYAEGTVKTETLGPFSVLKFVDIKGGSSETDLNEVNDDRTSVYLLSDDTLTVASNFDKDRENFKPAADVYTKANK